jgi:hypothetical protein
MIRPSPNDLTRFWSIFTTFDGGRRSFSTGFAVTGTAIATTTNPVTTPRPN